MKENKYDEDKFFEKYKQMPRSAKGLEAAGEWHLFRKMMPELKGKRVLDLGCGFGWHCRYAVDQGEFVFSVEHPIFTANEKQDCKIS